MTQTQIEPVAPFSTTRHSRVQIDAGSGKVPRSVRRLMDLEYLERAVHRMLAGWGNQFLEWDDKVAVCRHVWEQAEIVRRLRQRIDEFPGVKAGKPVSKKLETLANTVLLAPSFEDAVDGIYQSLSTALVTSYLDFIEHVHPIHDAPTHRIIQEIVTIKDLQRKWRSDYRRRHPHQADAAYLASIQQQLDAAGGLAEPLEVGDQPADPVGVNTSFRPLSPRIPHEWFIGDDKDVMPYISADFAQHIEARRLFWPIGYMREMGLAIGQLQWIYDSPYMPWEFHHDESRHLWDESRHGDSGHARLKDFGITIPEVGFIHRSGLDPMRIADETPRPLEVMSPKALYEQVFFIGMVAETGHFRVKREAYADFRDGGDLESAEMMLFDIIDETTHTQYARRWMPLLAEHAQVEHEGYEQRGARERHERQEQHYQAIEEAKQLPRDASIPAYAHYEKLLEIMRKKAPLSNAQTCPPRSPRPMG